MKNIWKFPLQTIDEQTILMPKGAQILCLQVQLGTPCIWALVSANVSGEKRTFKTYGTGHDIETWRSREDYIGTYQIAEGALVFHVFELTP